MTWHNNAKVEGFAKAETTSHDRLDSTSKVDSIFNDNDLGFIQYVGAICVAVQLRL